MHVARVGDRRAWVGMAGAILEARIKLIIKIPVVHLVSADIVRVGAPYRVGFGVICHSQSSLPLHSPPATLEYAMSHA